ncbi:S8 family peptidase [Krasilnikovia sp. MM14-A1259]|uniref:S8 family peptidase n=1 Tax=Krasilnikovia sp. MM14-A1259 TaxID=3373539 RepID=UPI00380FC7C7
MQHARRVVRGALWVAALAGVLAAVARPHGTRTPQQALKDFLVVLAPGAKPGEVPATAAALVARVGGTVHETYASGLLGFSAQVSPSAAARLAADPAVAYVTPDQDVFASAAEQAPSWGLDRVDQRARRLTGAYNYPATGGAGVTVYVLDSGVRIQHRDFGGRARYGWDFIGNDAKADDCEGHGTHVAGTIGGSRYGVAKRVRLVSVRVLDCNGKGSYAKIIAGIDWVTRHAARPAVVNMSIDGPASPVLDDAVRRAVAAGITFVVAAGNSSRDACKYSPAREPSALTVGATNRSDQRARFSNYGRCVDLFAPGDSITSDWDSGNNAHQVMSGTSMAAPHVAGAAALLLSAHRDWKPSSVRVALLRAASRGKVGSAGRGSPNLLLCTCR